MARTAPVPNIPAIPGMNPGVFIMGGGGGGGGKGGRGGKGNGSDQGGDGKNGGKDAQGGGKGAGACSPGSNGGCTNCGNKIGRGDPVDVITGEVFTVPKRDLYLPGFFALEIIRSYSSARREVDLGLGFGWRHSLAWSLEEGRRNLVIRTGDGRVMELPRPEADGQEVRAGAWTVYRGKGFYAVVPGNEFVHLFSPSEPDSSTYKLDHILYRNRGRISLHYERGHLVRAVDTAGRTVLFHRTREGRIRSITVPDPRGQAIVFARYEHDGLGNLIAATDADGNTTRFGYDEDHRLTQLTYPSGLVFHFVYDASGRCVETWGETPGQKDPALADGVPEVLVDGRKAKGIYHCRFVSDGDYTEVVDSVRLQRFFAGPDGQIAKAVSARGGVTSRTFDVEGRVTSVTDPTGATWVLEHDAMSNITRQSDPEGREIRIIRDFAGRELEIVDPAGGVTTIARDSAGEIAWVRDQNGGAVQFARDARGLVTETIDARGASHRFEFDGHGNCIRRTSPEGAVYRFDYDHWGRLVRMTDFSGAETLLYYSPSGQPTAVVDRLGRTTTMEYDSMGNLVREIYPDGTGTAWAYGGLNWLHRIRHADGSEIRIAHNREGWPLYFQNELGERHELTYERDGAVAAEREFQGTEIRYGHDGLGRVIWIDAGDGKHEFTYSPAGLLLAHTAPDGAERAFEYDERGEIVRATSGGVEVEWRRDRTGMILRELLRIDGVSYAVESQRDPAGNRTAMRTSLGHELAVRRDGNGLVRELWAGGERSVAIARNPVGVPTQRVFSEGGMVLDEHDAEGRLRRRSLHGSGVGRRPAGEPAWVGRGAPGAREWLYDYTAADEVHRVSSSDGADVEFTYDVRRHLLKRQSAAATEEFRVDAASNHVEVGPSAPARAYGPGNQLQALGDREYKYNARGFLVEKRRRVAGSDSPEITRYQWSAAGLLDAVELPDRSRVEFRYDAFARRVGKRVVRDGKAVETNHYVWDLLAMVHEVRRDGPGTPAAARTYLFEENSTTVPMGHRDAASGRWVHYLNDVNGTPGELVDPAGRSLGRLARTAYGRTRVVPGSTASTPFRFPGQYEDPETGLHYNRYRYYDPDAGRYISPDPIGVFGGLNLYAYGPNPIGWADPMGWYHVMTVLEAPASFSPSHNHPYVMGTDTRYRSGMTTTPCPDELRNNTCCHTEQKFAADVIAQHRAAVKNKKPPPFKNQNFRLQGKLPPCPTCHASLMRAANETGANITYEWEQPQGQTNTVSYNGSSAPTGTGRGAALVQGYTHTPDNTWKNNQSPPGGTQGETQAWGYTYGGSWNTYYAVKNS
ncbi:RHS repeat-associated core domain-containing protein [Sorangium sp. So ce1151]|uniref:RHS repeat-associated core domain-containing protein n=1 Tax=Sorangium sp. So ce1151 TaxID=3133332 RepID=UPI003F62D034